MSLPVPVIHRWSIDHDLGYLRVDVHFPSPIGKMEFYRVFRNAKGELISPYARVDIAKDKTVAWQWARAATNSNSFGGSIEGGHLLSQAVLQHEVLSKIAVHFGIELET